MTQTQQRSYHPFVDLNTDGRIDVRDLAEVRRRVGTALPPWEPNSSVAVQGAASARSRPVTRGLVSSDPILA